MTAFWIVIGAIGFIELLLSCPLTLTAEYEETLYARVRYLFFSYRIAPPKEKKPIKEQKEALGQPAEEQPKESKIRQLIQEQGLSGFLNLMKQLGAIAAGALKDILRKIHWKEFSVDLVVVGEDAAQTAVDYGYACSVVYTSAGILTALGDCKKYHVSVTAGFNEEKSRVKCRFRASAAPGSLLAAGIKAAWRYFKMVLKQKKMEKLNAD